MNAVACATECLSCALEARADQPPRERLHVGPRWRVAHAFGTSLPGWLVVLPRRHVTALDQLTAQEAADLGPLLRALTAALREVLGCSRPMSRYSPRQRASRTFTSMSCPGSRTWIQGCAARTYSACSAAIPPAMYQPR